MRDDEIIAVDAEPAAGVHHLVGGGRERHRRAERAAEIERQHHVLLLQGHVGERHVRHLAFEDEGPAIAEHRRGGDALEHGVDRDLALDAAFLGQRDRFAEAITSTISSRLMAIFIWQARPLPPMRVTFGPIASSTGLARSKPPRRRRS